MVVLAADVDLEEQALPRKTANAQSIINMLIRKCISLMAIGKVVVAVEAVEDVRLLPVKNETAHPMKSTSQDGRLEVVSDLGDILV
eukprot:scaffold30523_cov37-Cyclotella_meneghiniana.AAC.5